MKKRIIVLFLTYASFLSCETIVDANELLETEENIFINGYLSPSNDFLEISVTNTVPLFGKDFIYDQNEPKAGYDLFLIKNAIVTISNEDNETVYLHYSEEKSIYEIAATTFPIIEGGKYFLNVTIDDKEYTSSCTIPKEKVTDIFDPVIRNTTSGSILNIHFMDLLEQQNFYIIGAYLTLVNDSNYNDTTILGIEAFKSDYINNEGTITTNTSDIHHSFNQGVDLFVNIKIAHVEKIMHDFLKTTYININQNPLGEITIPPSNIIGDNAIGVFAGYQLTEKEVRLIVLN